MKHPPTRARSAIRPYIRQTILVVARSRFPELAALPDAEFIEFCLLNAGLSCQTQAITTQPTQEPTYEYVDRTQTQATTSNLTGEPIYADTDDTDAIDTDSLFG